MGGLSVSWETRPGPMIRIDCPACGVSPAIARTEERVERLLLVGLIPVVSKTTTFVVCDSCGKRLHSRIPLDDLPKHTRDQLRPFLTPGASVLTVILAITALVMACTPFVGLLFAIPAVLLTMSTPGWPKILAWISLAVSAALTCFFLLLFLTPMWGAWNFQWNANQAPPAADRPIGQLPPDVMPKMPDFRAGRFAGQLDNVPAAEGNLPAAEDVDLDDVLSQLKSSNPGFEHFAVSRLTRVTPEEDRRQEVSELLLPMLSDGNPFARQAALKALATWHTPEAVPEMIESAADSNFAVRWAAFEALAQVRDERAAEAVAKRLPDVQDQSLAAQSLIKMGPVAEDHVLTYIDHPDVMVRMQVFQILAEVGSQKSIDRLSAIARQNDFQTRLQAETAMEAIRSRDEIGQQ